MTLTNSTLFRKEALDHYLQAEQGQGLVRIAPPWTWMIAGVLVAALCAGLAASFIGSAELNGRGRGIIRPMAGVRTLLSQTGGTVQTIKVRSGQHVKAGSILVTIDAPQLKTELLSAERELDAVMTDYKLITQRREAAYGEQSLRLRNRIGQLNLQLESQRQSVVIYERHLATRAALEKDSIISTIEVDAAREELAQAERQVGATQQALDQALQEQAALESSRQNELWQIQQVIDNASIKKDALSVMCRQTEIPAPEDGTVEALLVKQGEVIGAGQAVGKLIPAGSPLHVVSFLSEKDRAFVKTGDTVHLELDQLPYSEFGTLRAKVIRISDDLASPFEITEALGENQRFDIPTFRVELKIDDSTATEKANVALRSGMLMNVRYTLRKQRFITVVIDPLRRWFR